MFKYSLIVLLSLNMFANDTKVKEDTEGDLYKFSREIRESVSELKDKEFKLKDYYYKITNRNGCFFDKDTSVKILSGLTDGYYKVMDKKNDCIDFIKVESLYRDVPIVETKIEEIKVEQKEIVEQKPIIVEPIKEIVNYNVYTIATYLKENQINNFIKSKLNGYKTNIVQYKKGVYTLELYLKEDTKENQLKFIKTLSKDAKFKKIESLEEIKEIH